MVGQKPFYLLDTNMVTFMVTGRSEAAREHYTSIEQQARFGISCISEGEMRYGFAKKPGATRVYRYVNEFLGRTESIPWDSKAAQVFGDLRAKTEALGLTFGALDLLIAAHASALNATLVTHDTVLKRLSDFVSIEDWATDLR